MLIKIFLFHRVSPETDVLWPPISPKKFDRIIRFISTNYQVIELETTILNNQTLKTSKPLAAIVFDDGYKDFIEYAFPILKKYHCPSSMYVVTDCIENQLPPWTYILDYHFLHSKKLEINLNNRILPPFLQLNKFSNIQTRLQFAKQFKPYLKTITNVHRVELYKQVLESLNDVEIPRNLIMNWKEVKEIKDNGVLIGSHSMTHPVLSNLEHELDIINEIKGSKEMIAKHLGSSPITISYPLGGYNEFIKQKAIEYGYKIGLAVNNTMYNSRIHDFFEIPRIELYHENFIKTRLRTSGIISTINKWLKP
jgi:peptidoglycan/xylan/chitin deacetylase (PgdA/CDA1 family)